VYTDPRVERFVADHYLPVRVHVQEQRDEFQRLGSRYGAQWTPTILILDSSGQEQHRIEGFLPPDDFTAQLALGVGHAAFARGDFVAAERQFREVLDHHRDTEMAAEALYWAGVSRYKATGDASALRDTAREFGQRYTQSSWAKKSSVWK
jgi:hypothetical protein